MSGKSPPGPKAGWSAMGGLGSSKGSESECSESEKSMSKSLCKSDSCGGALTGSAVLWASACTCLRLVCGNLIMVGNTCSCLVWGCRIRGDLVALMPLTMGCRGLYTGDQV